MNESVILDEIRSKLPFQTPVSLGRNASGGPKTIALTSPEGKVLAIARISLQGEFSAQTLADNPNAWLCEAEVLTYLTSQGSSSVPLAAHSGFSVEEGWSYAVMPDYSATHFKYTPSKSGAYPPIAGKHRWQVAKALAEIIDIGLTNPHLAQRVTDVVKTCDEPLLKRHPLCIANGSLKFSSFFFPVQSSAPAVIAAWHRARICRVPRMLADLRESDRLRFESFRPEDFLELLFSLSQTLKKKISKDRFVSETMEILKK